MYPEDTLSMCGGGEPYAAIFPAYFRAHLEPRSLVPYFPEDGHFHPILDHAENIMARFTEPEAVADFRMSAEIRFEVDTVPPEGAVGRVRSFVGPGSNRSLQSDVHARVFLDVGYADDFHEPLITYVLAVDGIRVRAPHQKKRT